MLPEPKVLMKNEYVLRDASKLGTKTYVGVSMEAGLMVILLALVFKNI